MDNLTILKNLIDNQLDYDTFNLKEILAPNTSPADIISLFHALGWEREDFDTNGWEQDTWNYMVNPQYNFKITFFYSGYFGNLELWKED